jgi:hypothetical protein
VKFTVEKTCLSENAGVRRRQEDFEPLFALTEASDLGSAVETYIRRENAELVEEVQWFPGQQAIAAVRKGSRFYMLQFAPDDGELENESIPGGAGHSREMALRR